MLHTVSTMVSLMLSAGSCGLIAASLLEDRAALRRALARAAGPDLPPLPPHTHRIAGARAARIIQLMPATAPLRAAA